MRISHCILTTRIAIVIGITCSFSYGLSAQTKHGTKEQAIAQMNYITNTLTVIENNPSIEVLSNVQEQLFNNLQYGQILYLDAVESLWTELSRDLNSLKMTDGDKAILREVQSIRNRNLIWSSLSSALNPAMIMTSGGSTQQLAFYALLSIARTSVEYCSRSSEYDAEELKAMYELVKSQMTDINNLKTEAQNTQLALFRQFNLNDDDRLRLDDAKEFYKYISNSDPNLRRRLLEDNGHKYVKLADYYYHLGMAYVDLGDYHTAKKHFDKYLSMYNDAPIFDRDEKTACICLAQLTYEPNLSKEKKKSLIRDIDKNIEHSGAATIQTALVLYRIGEKEEAFIRVRKGIDDIYGSDKSSLVMMAACLADEIKAYPEIWADMCQAVNNCSDLDVNSYMAFILKANESAPWKDIEDILTIKNAKKGKGLSQKFDILINGKFRIDLDQIFVYHSNCQLPKVDIFQDDIEYSKGIISKEDLLKIYTFKKDPKTIYNFFSSVSGDNQQYCVKNDIIDSSTKKLVKPIEYFEGMQDITSGDEKKIRRLCKAQKNNSILLNCSPSVSVVKKTMNWNYSNLGDFLKKNTTIGLIIESTEKPDYWQYVKDNYFPKSYVHRFSEQMSSIHKFFDEKNSLDIKFKGDSLTHIEIPLYEQTAECIYIVLEGSVQTVLTYIFNKETKKVEPFSISAGGETRYYRPEELCPIDYSKSSGNKSVQSGQNRTQKQSWFKQLTSKRNKEVISEKPQKEHKGFFIKRWFSKKDKSVVTKSKAKSTDVEKKQDKNKDNKDSIKAKNTSIEGAKKDTKGFFKKLFRKKK